MLSWATPMKLMTYTVCICVVSNSIKASHQSRGSPVRKNTQLNLNFNEISNMHLVSAEDGQVHWERATNGLRVKSDPDEPTAPKYDAAEAPNASVQDLLE